MPTEINDSKICIGREPVFNRKCQAIAYELLFRLGNLDTDQTLDDNAASAQLIYDCLMEIDLENVFDNKVAYISFPYELLINKIGHILPTEQVVLEIEENTEPSDAFLDGMKDLVSEGFSIALDNFNYDPKWDPILKYTSVVKINVHKKPIAQIKAQYDILKKRGVLLLANGLETETDYDIYHKMGFDYFQGYFFEKPNIIEKDKLPDNQVAILQLISKLQNPNISVHEIEELISQTVTLNYKLFHYINSAYFNLPRKFDSVREAVAYIGIKKVQYFSSLLALSDINIKFSELIVVGLTRARMCELMAKKAQLHESQSYFMTGLFSILEALLSSPLDQILEKLPISPDVVDALLYADGALGEALRCSIAYEQCIWDEMKFRALSSDDISAAYWKAVAWSQGAAGNLS